MSYADVYKSTLGTDSRGNPTQRPGGHNGEYMTAPKASTNAVAASSNTPRTSGTNQGGTTMTTSSTNMTATKLNKNVPSFIEAGEAQELTKEVRSFKVFDQDITVNLYEDGYVRFQTKWTANKLNFGGTFNHPDGTITHEGKGRYSGLISAALEMMDNNVGTYAPGIHFPKGIDNLGDIMESNSNTGEGKIQWGWVTPEWRETLATKHNVTQVMEDVFAEDGTCLKRADEVNLWTSYTVKRGRIVRDETIAPEKWADFVAKLAAKGLTPKSHEAQYAVDEHNTKWAIQHKHDGIEWIMRVLAGKLMVGVKTAEIVDVHKLDNKFGMLFASAETRKEYAEGKVQYYATKRAVKATTYAMNQPGFVAPKGTEEVTNGKMVKTWNGSEIVNVKNSEMVGKTVTFVKANNQDAGRYCEILVKDLAMVKTVVNMSVTRKGMIAFVTPKSK